eukprot:Polyplicarium_translucidae@DN2173_c0_g1_i3.p1
MQFGGALQCRAANSSAYPAGQSPPVLSAPIHAVSDAVIGSLRPESFRYRQLRATTSDFQQCRMLHSEWFPIRYEDNFFDAVCGGGVFSLAAVLQLPSPLKSEEYEEFIAAIITVSQDPVHIRRDDAEIVLRAAGVNAAIGPDATATDGPSGSRFAAGDPRGHVAYILTVGVAERLKRIGLARELIYRSLSIFEAMDPSFISMYLHVVSYNHAAMRLYQTCGFRELALMQSFYYIEGEQYGGLLYAYISAGARRWTELARMGGLRSPTFPPLAGGRYGTFLVRRSSAMDRLSIRSFWRWISSRLSRIFVGGVDVDPTRFSDSGV